MTPAVTATIIFSARVAAGFFDAPLPYRADYDGQIEEETGFQIHRHRLIFEGLCPDCRKKSGG